MVRIRYGGSLVLLLALSVLGGDHPLSQQAAAQPTTAGSPAATPSGQADDVAFCGTVEDLQKAVNVLKKPHVVIHNTWTWRVQGLSVQAHLQL